MYSLSHFLYRRVIGVDSDLVISRTSDWAPVLERVWGLGEAFSRLKTLSLVVERTQPVDLEKAERLARALRGNDTVTSISIERIDLQDKLTLDTIVGAFEGVQRLRSVRLCHVKGRQEVARPAPGADAPSADDKALARLLSEAREGVENLEIDGIDLGFPYVLPQLAEGLAKTGTLKLFSLTNTKGFAPSMYVWLTASLHLPSCGLESLDFPDAHLSTSAVALLAADLASSTFRASSLSVTVVLEGGLPMELLAAGLRNNRSVKRLDLRVCFSSKSTREGYRALVKLAEENEGRVHVSCCRDCCPVSSKF
jgi:hypothetical protein